MSRPIVKVHEDEATSLRFQALQLPISSTQLLKHCLGKVGEADLIALRLSRNSSPWYPAAKQAKSRAAPAEVMQPTFFDTSVKPVLKKGITNSELGRVRRMVDALESASTLWAMVRLPFPKPLRDVELMREAWLQVFDDILHKCELHVLQDSQARSRGGVMRHADSRLLDDLTIRMMRKLSYEGWRSKSELAKKLAPRLARLARKLKLRASWTVKARRDAVLRLLGNEKRGAIAIFQAHCLSSA